MKRFELSTLSLARRCSTTELHPQSAAAWPGRLPLLRQQTLQLHHHARTGCPWSNPAMGGGPWRRRTDSSALWRRRRAGSMTHGEAAASHKAPAWIREALKMFSARCTGEALQFVFLQLAIIQGLSCCALWLKREAWWRPTSARRLHCIKVQC